VSRSYKNKEIPVTELIVLYRMPNDPEHFEKYYREVIVFDESHVMLPSRAPRGADAARAPSWNS
jgi:hypothetical protein